MVGKLRAADDDDAYEEMAPELAKDAGFRVEDHGEEGFSYAKDDSSAADPEFYSTEAEAWVACCDDNGLRPDADDARQSIQEDPLSVQVRSGWYSPGDTPEAEEYEILLCTGGPAVRIVGNLGQYNEPDDARIECQDWFTSWTEVFDGIDRDVLLEYARCHYFGE